MRETNKTPKHQRSKVQVLLLPLRLVRRLLGRGFPNEALDRDRAAPWRLPLGQPLEHPGRRSGRSWVQRGV